MKFLDYIEQGFKRVLVVDTEFRFDSTKTTPEKVLCFVYQDVFTGEVFRYWEHDLFSSQKHFNYDECLLISFNATAEYGSYLKQLHGKPKQMWDCFVENKRLYFPFREKGKFGMLDTCEAYGIKDIMSKEEKEQNIDLIINNTSYNLAQQKRILDYCQADVETTVKLFIAQAQDIEQKNRLNKIEDFERELWQIMFRGYSQGCVAQVQKFGLSVDNGLLNDFDTYWPDVKDRIIKRRNEKLQVFNEDLSFSNEKFKSLVKRCGLQFKWPLLKSGFFTTNDKVVKKYEQLTNHPLLIEYRQLKKLLNTTKLSNYDLGYDGRVRTPFNMFGTLTGRCTPSSSKYPLSASKWARNFIKPGWGMVMYYIDYTAQEPAIMAYLSGDKNLIENYQTGDVYIKTAQQIGIIKDMYATKHSHEKERDVIKVLFLANTYGQGVQAIADQLGTSVFKAKDYLGKFKKLYSTYDRWIQGLIDGSALTGNLTTGFGWQRWIKGNTRWKDGKRVSIKNQIKKLPIQATGGDVLRQALIDLLSDNFEVNALVHDAIIISVPTPESKERLEKAKEIMMHASMKVVGGPIRVDHEEISGNWKQKAKHQDIFDEIFREIKEHKKILNLYKNEPPARELGVGVLGPY
jgi:DNA polymerase I-like protein with 3'-5' exonuclease and polymerase domains